MGYTPQYPIVFQPKVNNVEQGFRKVSNEFSRVYQLLSESGALQLFGTKRQSVLVGSVDNNGNPNFITASGLNVSIDGSSKPIYITFANGFNDTGTVDLFVKIDSLISNAWTLPANNTCYLYIDKDINNGLLSYGYSLLPDLYQKTSPSSPTLDQHYFSTNEMKMYRWNGSAWENKQRIFLAKAVSTASSTTLTIYGFGNELLTDPRRPGEYIEAAFSSPPRGYLNPDGSAVSRSIYSNLFAAIGTTYGAGDGSTTFNLPDRRDRFSLAKGTTYATLGATGGEAAHTLTIPETPNHSHIFTFYNGTGSSGAPSSYAANYAQGTATTSAVGGGQAHNNMPPYFVVNYFIKY